MPTAAMSPKQAEIKTRTTEKTKTETAAIYAHRGLSLNDAINMFLVKSIEVGGLPFELRVEAPSYQALSRIAYKALLNEEVSPCSQLNGTTMSDPDFQRWKNGQAEQT